jgi:hypothetical protein
MFVPMKVSEFWGSADGSPTDAWFYSNGWEETSRQTNRPYYCETSKKWLLVWKPIPHEEAIQASRIFYGAAHKAMWYISDPRLLTALEQKVYEQSGKRRPPIRLWEPTAIDPSVLERLVERADPYHESNFALWEKYPDIVRDGCYATAHKILLTNKGLNKHPRWYEKPKTSISVKSHDFSGWINVGAGGLPSDRSVYSHSFFHEEMAGLMASFAATHSLRKRKIQQSTVFGSCVNPSRESSKLGFLRHQVDAMKQYTQSPGSTPQFPPFDFDRAVLVQSGRSQGKSTDIDWAALLRTHTEPLILLPRYQSACMIGREDTAE